MTRYQHKPQVRVRRWGAVLGLVVGLGAALFAGAPIANATLTVLP